MDPTTATGALERFQAERDQLLSVGNHAQARAEELDLTDDYAPEAQEHYDASIAAMDRYRELLPELPVSRCPFTDEVLTWAIDTVDLDGWFWDKGNPVRRFTGTVPPHFLAFGGSMRLHIPLTWAPFLAVPGPGAPAVLPAILEDPDVVAVISSLEIGPHTGWPVTYWAPRGGDKRELVNDWGSNHYDRYLENGQPNGWDATATIADDYDFDLEPWLTSGKLRWIAPNDTTLALRIGPHDCPYLNVPGEHLIARIHEGQLWHGR
jgi:hypothetical protein